MEYIILWRNIDSKLYIFKESEQIKIFPDKEKAEKFIKAIGWSEKTIYQIIELQI